MGDVIENETKSGAGKQYRVLPAVYVIPRSREFSIYHSIIPAASRRAGEKVVVIKMTRVENPDKPYEPYEPYKPYHLTGRESLEVRTTRTRRASLSYAETAAGKSLFYRFWKRCFDFISSLCVSAVLIIPAAIIAVVIMCMDFGNPFYVQKRLGENGKPIRVLKFRSMRMNADCLEKFLTPEQIAEYKQEFKLRDDPRLIGYKKPGDGNKCFGAFLRRSNIDELPQIIWNICIMGNMSVVGPRPILPEELKKYYTDREERRLFLSAKPGLTGYWQAYARNEATYESGQRQQMELNYIKNRSFMMDVKIIIKTFTRFTGRGAY